MQIILRLLQLLPQICHHNFSYPVAPQMVGMEEPQQAATLQFK